MVYLAHMRTSKLLPFNFQLYLVGLVMK